MENFADSYIVCVDCKMEFCFTLGEKDFLQKLFDKGEVKEIIPPKRCVECRTKRKASYANYNKLHSHRDY